jgi:5'-3' exonuclease
VKVHLVDGTYELFRAHFGAPAATSPDGREVGATRGLMRSLIALLTAPDVTHVACAFDHVIESFRNGLYDGYKTSAGVPRELLAQFTLAERATHALGIVVWPMVEFEADDALATAAARWADAPEVEQVVICTPDKDLAQCVRGSRVVMLDRRRRRLLDESGVKAKFGVLPESMPDWLALVGDSSDGYPGLPGWGPKTAAALLTRYRRLEDIPSLEQAWATAVRGAAGAGQALRDRRADAFLYRELARLRTDVPLAETLDDLRWRGSRRAELEAVCAEVGDPDLAARMPLWREPA